MLTKFLISASILLISYSTSVFANEPSDTNSLWKKHIENRNRIIEQFNALKSKRKDVSPQLVKMIAVAEDISKLNSKLYSEKTSDAEKSVLQKEVSDLEGSNKLLVEDLLSNYATPLLEFFTHFEKIQKTNKKIKIDAAVNTALDMTIKEVRFTYDTYQNLFDGSCINSDQSFNKKCAVKWVGSCAENFTSKGKKLGTSYISSDLEIQDKLFETQKDAMSYIAPETEDSAKNKIATEYGAFLVNACLFISEQGYDFEKNELYFENHKTPEVVSNLRYFYGVTRDEFREKCNFKRSDILNKL